MTRGGCTEHMPKGVAGKMEEVKGCGVNDVALHSYFPLLSPHLPSPLVPIPYLFLPSLIPSPPLPSLPSDYLLLVPRETAGRFLADLLPSCADVCGSGGAVGAGEGGRPLTEDKETSKFCSM